MNRLQTAEIFSGDWILFSFSEAIFRLKIDKATFHSETINESANFQSSWPAATEPTQSYIWNFPQYAVYKLTHIESHPRNANSYDIRVAKLTVYHSCRSSNFLAIVTVIFTFITVIFKTNVKNANLTIQRLEKFGIHQGAVITYTVTFRGNKSLTAFGGYFAEACIFRMMTSSNGNIFRVTSHLCGEFTGPRGTKASDAELWCFLWSASE